MGQVISAFASDNPNPVLHDSGSLPGLVSYGAGLESAPVIDAFGQFAPGMLTGGNLTGGLEALQDGVEAAAKGDALGVLYYGAQAYDASQDILGIFEAEPTPGMVRAQGAAKPLNNGSINPTSQNQPSAVADIASS